MLSIYILYKDIILVIGLLISIWLRSLCLAELDLLLLPRISSYSSTTILSSIKYAEFFFPKFTTEISCLMELIKNVTL